MKRFGKIGMVLLMLAALAIIIFILALTARSKNRADATPQGLTNGNFTKAPGAESAVGSRQFPERFFITADDPALGNPNANIVVVEFIDFQCPFCRQAFPIMRSLLAKYPDKIYFEVRDFPVVSLHPNAVELAEAGECANAQEKFWQLHDRIFLNAEKLEGEKADIKEVWLWARQTGLNMEQFTTCMQTHAKREEVLEDAQAAEEAGVRGTPTFFINGKKVEGVVPMAAWEELVNLK